jgi:isopenicillin N synthase-like dioxygenase
MTVEASEAKNGKANQLSVNLPEIDISPALNGTRSGIEQVGREIRKASQNIGFYALLGHGISRELQASIFEANARFHALPTDQKLEIKLNSYFRGYQPLEGSTLKISTVETTPKPNQSESFFIRHEVEKTDPNYGKPVQGPNQWPQDLPGFREVVLAYHDAMREMITALLPAYSFAMEQDEAVFRALFSPPSTILRMLHYPPHDQPRHSGVFGIAPHTDFGFITVLAQDNVGGLEFRPRKGNWTPVPVIEDSFVVNSGDAVHRFTNGRFASTPHRVINTSSERSRYSVGFFFDPSLDTMVQPLPGFGEPSNTSPPVLFLEHLFERLDANYPERNFD